MPMGVSAKHGHVDFRLARASTLAQYRRGHLDRAEVCDAHPELVRAAHQVGVEVADTCPICDAHPLVHVTYVFGPRLPRHGRCITLRGELARLAKRPGVHVAYVVEACRKCNWNHLNRRVTLGDDDELATEPETEPAASE